MQLSVLLDKNFLEHRLRAGPSLTGSQMALMQLEVWALSFWVNSVIPGNSEGWGGGGETKDELQLAHAGRVMACGHKGE